MNVVREAVWAISNISTDCREFRDTVIAAGGLIKLVDVVKKYSAKTLVNMCCWALSNLCRGHPLPKYEDVCPAIIALS
jgi:hypothetical protein